MKLAAWILAVTCLAIALVAPPTVAVAVAVVSAVAWGYLFTLDYLEHR